MEILHHHFLGPDNVETSAQEISVANVDPEKTDKEAKRQFMQSQIANHQKQKVGHIILKFSLMMCPIFLYLKIMFYKQAKYIHKCII